MTGRRDDWLWDRSGAPDAELQDLEALLRRFAHDDRPLALDRLPVRRARRRWPFAVLAAAALALAFALLRGSLGQGDMVLAPGAAARLFEAQGATKGEATEVRLGELAVVRLFAGSRLWFRHWQPGQALFELEAGGFEARVQPPPAVQPRFFQVDTPLGRCIDQGCRYTLRLLEDGGVRIEVSEGIVTFPVGDREAWVPAGASLTVAPGARFAIPLFADVDPIVRKRLAEAFAVKAKKATEDLRIAWKELVDACDEPRDSLVLWHLLSDPDEEVRRMAEARLLDRLGPPESDAGKVESWDPQIWLAFLRRTGWQLAK
jgi:hypothetical protein